MRDMPRFLPLLIALLACSLPASAQDEAATGEPDALSAEALDRMVRTEGETLNFDDVIRRTGENSRRLESYDLRWVNANRVQDGGSFPVAKDTYRNDMTVQKANLPWSCGFWTKIWCSLALLRSGSHGLSALEKFDSYALSRTGKLPGAAAWEAFPKNGHNAYQDAFEKPVNQEELTKPREKIVKVKGPDGQDVEISGRKRHSWRGHCNGWAAAACLVPQPPATLEAKLTAPLKVARLKYANYREAYDIDGDGPDQYKLEDSQEKRLAFSRADLKGLLCESFMDCNADMTHPVIKNRYLERKGVRDRGYVYYGTQFGYLKDPAAIKKAMDEVRANGGTEFKDIWPHNFHRICLDYLGQRNMAFVTEIDADNQKDNHPTYGYKYVQSYNASAREYRFEAEVTYATYADPSHDGPKALVKSYTFRMKLDDRNRVVSSEWTGDSEFNHPDFVWVPLSNVPAAKLENPRLDYSLVQEILKQGGVDEEDRPVTEGVETAGNVTPVPAADVVADPPARTETTPAGGRVRTGAGQPSGDFGSAAPVLDDDRFIRSDTDGN